MEINNKNNNGGVEQQQQQLCKSALKRKFNEVANDPAADEEQHQPPEKLSTQNCGGQQGNDASENLHLESLTREDDLIQLFQKQLANQNEAHNKELEAVKKEAEESAKQQAKEMTTKMEELKRALLASQQKHLDSAKQAKELSQRNVQLEQEKAAVHEDLRQKMAEIVKMHTEVEEKSEQLAEKAKQIDALLVQLNESTSDDKQSNCKFCHHHQIGLPTDNDKQMKIQLSLETWYDWLAFVPRDRLGKIVPMIGDRKFASIVQRFLHEYGEGTINCIRIVAPYEEDPSGHPRVRTWQNNRLWRFEMAEAQMPANIKNFNDLELSYFDQSVLNFMLIFCSIEKIEKYLFDLFKWIVIHVGDFVQVCGHQHFLSNVV